MRINLDVYDISWTARSGRRSALQHHSDDETVAFLKTDDEVKSSA